MRFKPAIAGDREPPFLSPANAGSITGDVLNPG
jgi:hypothetical protein